MQTKYDELARLADKGPWRAGINKRDGKHFVESDDFTHDVRLYVDGDFGGDDDKGEYAQGIATQLNASATYPAMHADLVKARADRDALAEALQVAKSSLEWYMDDHHSPMDESDHEVIAQIDAALDRLK